MKPGDHYTTPQSTINREHYETLIRLALAEDAPSGDPTSESIFPPDVSGRARILAREEGVLCGCPLIADLLLIDGEQTGSPLALKTHFHDGEHFRSGDVLMDLQGPWRQLLRLERVVLNFLQYLSGIATTTARTIREAGSMITVLDTRKTLPGYRRLAKYAVFCGGGRNHRLHLGDMAMIKDNHIAAAGGIREAVERIREIHPELPLEIEVDHPGQLEEALRCRPQVILLDNMDRPTLEEALRILRRIPEDRQPLIEISGGWTGGRLGELQGLGPLGVSMGSLTHTTRFLDLSMEFSE